MKLLNKQKRVLIVGLQLTLLLFAAGCVFYGNFALRSVGMLAVLCALAIGKRAPPTYATCGTSGEQSALALRPWHWIVGFAFIVALLASYLWLQQDAITGGKSAAPAYVFALIVLLGGIWWAVLVGRLIQSRYQ